MQQGITLPIFEEETTFAKFSIDTLFYVFYHQQGLPQHYLSAVELKNRGWVFHKKFKTWFKKQADINGKKVDQNSKIPRPDPKSSSESDVGTYIYFDYESGWCPLVKENFVFEFKYMETELQS